MEIQKTTGITLSNRAFGEADYIIKIFTKDYGKRDFVFKGLKKSKRRPHAITQPGTFAGLVYYFHEEKNLHTVNEYQIVQHHLCIRESLSKIYLLYYLIESVEKTSGYNDANRPLFDLLAAGIDTLSRAERMPHLAAFFTLHLLRLHGVLPDFNKCKFCGRDDFKEFIFDNIDFQTVCGKCGLSRGSGFFLNGNSRKFARESLAKKLSALNIAEYPDKDISDLLFHLSLFMQNYFHVEIKSKDMLIPELLRAG